MTLPSGGIVQIAMRIRYFEQRITNVFHYRALDAIGDGAATGIGETFWNTVKGAWRATVLNDGRHIFDQVDVRFLGGDEDYGVYVIPQAERTGTRTQTGTQFMPPFVAANMTLNPVNRLTRPGSKRIAGLLEIDNDAGKLQAGMRTLLVNLGQTFLAELNSGVFLDRLEPVIYSRPTDTRPAGYANRIASVVVTENITSQNTRKFGRGD